MKKLIMSGLILATMGITIVGCKKEKVETVNNNNVSTKNIDYTLDQIPLLENKQDILQLMLNPNDKDEEKLNKYLYEIGLATKDLIKNEEFNQTIIGMAKKSDNQTAYLLDLRTEAPIFFKIINENLAKNSLSLERIAEDMTHIPLGGNPEYPSTMEIEKYVPAIFIPNIGSIDRNKQPLISPNIEVNSKDNSEIENFVVTWYFDNKGSEFEIILGEETSLKTTNPLFFIDHASPKGYLPKPTNVELEDVRPETNENRGFNDIKNFRLSKVGVKSGYRYEPWSWDNSEFALAITKTTIGYPSHHIFWNSNNDRTVTIMEMDNLGTFNVNHAFAPNYVPTYGLNGYKIFYNTFERDWNRQPKSLGYALNVLGSPGTNDDTYLSGRRRYNGDWYQWIPSTLSSHPLPINWYQWLTVINPSSWKSNMSIRSVE